MRNQDSNESIAAQADATSRDQKEPTATQIELSTLIREIRELNESIKLGLARFLTQHRIEKDKNAQKRDEIERLIHKSHAPHSGALLQAGLHQLVYLTEDHLAEISRSFLGILSHSIKTDGLSSKDDTWTNNYHALGEFRGLAVALNLDPNHRSIQADVIQIPITNKDTLKEIEEKGLVSLSSCSIKPVPESPEKALRSQVIWDFRNSGVWAVRTSIYHYNDGRSKDGTPIWLLFDVPELPKPNDQWILSFVAPVHRPIIAYVSDGARAKDHGLPMPKVQVWRLSQFRQSLTVHFKCAGHILAMLYTPSPKEATTPSSSIFHFLRCFTAPWYSIKSKSENTRWSVPSDVRDGQDKQCIFQHHIRYFYPVVKDNGMSEIFNKKTRQPGIYIHRERGTIPAFSMPSIEFAEGRLSVCVVTMRKAILPWIKVVILEDNMIRELDMDFEGEIFTADWMDYRYCIPGAKMFMSAIDRMIQKEWQRKWNSLLDEIGNCVRLQVTDLDNLKTREELMFDNSFNRSEFYFTILQFLRIFSQAIRDTGSDLDGLGYDLQAERSTPDIRSDQTAQAVEWKQITATFEEISKRLLQRIFDRTEEVKSLRDGLFNATSLQETTKSTSMNRYIMVFTIMTIVYLPLGFVAAIFSTPITGDGVDPRLVTNFIISSIMVSGGTYAIAFPLILFIERRKIIMHIINYLLKLTMTQGANHGKEAEWPGLWRTWLRMLLLMFRQPNREMPV